MTWGMCVSEKDIYIYCARIPVSYTHLDVYKRQNCKRLTGELYVEWYNTGELRLYLIFNDTNAWSRDYWWSDWGMEKEPKKLIVIN